MKRNHRVCKSCGKPIARNHHWHLVGTTAIERVVARFMGRPLAHHEPQHHNCKHPSQQDPHTFVGKVRRLPQDEPFTEEEMGVLR